MTSPAEVDVCPACGGVVGVDECEDCGWPDSEAQFDADFERGVPVEIADAPQS